DWCASVSLSVGSLAAGDRRAFLQSLEFSEGVSLGATSRLRLRAGADTHIEEYTVDQDWRPLAFSKTGGFAASELVFAGYGIVAPAADGFGEDHFYTHL